MHPPTHFMFSFDKTYAVRALDTYDSLHPTPYPVTFWFLCLDQESKTIIEKLHLPDAHCITLEEMGNNALMRTRPARTNTEFAMSSKSAFMSFLLTSGRVKDGDALILSDVDIHFFPGAWDYIESMHKAKEHAIFMTPHHFPPHKEYLVQEVGFYNGGFIYFRINEVTKTCIHRYGREATEWTYLWHDYENFRHSDQMYMEYWRTLYDGFYEVTHKGVNVGTWNIENYKVTEDVKGNLFIDEYPLICYHYHGLRLYFDRNGRIKPYPICVYNDKIYDAYVESLQRAHEKLLAADPNWKYNIGKPPGILRLVKQKINKKLRELKK
ncbi:MAG: hypothetical protein V4481_02735 [Patescibacteria group bacterium]